MSSDKRKVTYRQLFYKHPSLPNTKLIEYFQGASEVDKHDTPDSTTKERISFYEGDEVFVLQKDGRSFLGVVVEVSNLRYRFTLASYLNYLMLLFISR